MITRQAMIGAAEAVLARERFDAWVQLTKPGYESGRFQQILCEEMQRFSDAVRRREGPRLALMAPPRHGKSFHVAERMPVWHLGRNPGDSVIIASYAKTPAEDRSEEARRIVLTPEAQLAFPHLRLSRSIGKKDDWALEGGRGRVYAGGLNGTLTSKGAEMLIVDDPIRGWADAHSATKRNKAWRTYTNDARSRLHAGGGIIMMLTRWHEDDVCARALKHYESEGWRVLRFPAIADNDDLDPHTGEVWRRKGQALDPVRWPRSELLLQRDGMIDSDWRCLYQQDPSPDDGIVWRKDWFRYWTRDPSKAPNAVLLPSDFDQVIVSADLSGGSLAEGASFCCYQAWGRLGRNFYLLDEDRGRWLYPEARERLKKFCRRHQPRRVLIENESNGRPLINELDAILPILPVKPEGSKEARAHAAAPPLEGGRVLVPHPVDCAWIIPWLAEVCGFPSAANDDRIDTAGQAIRHWSAPRSRVIIL